MALSFYSDFGYLHQQDNQSNFQQTHQYSDKISATDFIDSCHDDNNYSFGFLDDFIDPSNFEVFDGRTQDSFTNLLPYFSSPSDDVVTLSADIFSPEQEFGLFEQYPKRQKCCRDFLLSRFEPTCYDRFIAYSGPVVTEPLPKVILPVAPLLPKLGATLPVVFNEGIRTESVKKPSLSVQSIAARERRRKITEKTQELGKLIPGSNKISTAEMFQAASKYVKFVAGTTSDSSTHELKSDGQLMHTEELHDLLVSPVVQEKLYSEEKCLVLTEFVRTIANNQAIQSKSLILEEIGQLTE